MSIAEQLESLRKVRGATVGYGPNHPVTPEPTYAKLLCKHLEKYPFLHNHPDFIEFLDRDAGARIHQEETPESRQYWSIDIYGIGVWEEADMGSPDGPDGFYEFALVVTGSHSQPSFQQMQAVFAFDGTGTRPNVVYVNASPTDDPDSGRYHPYCKNFDEWLLRLIEADGRLMPAAEETEPATAGRA